MTFSPTDSPIFAPLFSEAEIAAVFSDAQFITYLLQVEAALARAQGRLGLIPAAAAAQIEQGAAALTVDMARLQASTEKAGVPVSELVRQLRQHVGTPAADYVHWGATTQDIMDTAVVLQIRAALTLLEPTLDQLITHLAHLADRYRHCLMAGRTHSQQALPITFGLKAAGWLAPVLRHRQRLTELKPRLLVVQCGGAAGTMAAWGSSGLAVQAALAQALDLAVPLLPWHTQRDTLAEVAGWLSLVSGSLAKMAQDIILLAQTEVGEVRETADTARGGSSTMPQKQNPMISEAIMAAARTNAALLSTLHHALIQEHERATHSWQMEWLNLPTMFSLTASAIHKAAFLSRYLVIHEDQMQQNVAAAQGLILGEAISFALSPTYMSRVEANALIKAACQVAVAEGRHLVDVVQEKTAVSLDWQALKDETQYLGAADALIERVLKEVNQK